MHVMIYVAYYFNVHYLQVHNDDVYIVQPGDGALVLVLHHS